MNLPEGFVEEYQAMRERIEWAHNALGRDQDVAQGKTVVEEFHRFYDRWRPKIQDPEMCRGLDEVREHIKANMERGLERIFLAHLYEVIEARKDWWAGEQLIKLSVNFIELMKHAPPSMRPQLEQIHREHLQKEFDPETHYREAERAAQEDEANFRKALAGLEVDWPERVDAALRQKLENLDGPGANEWQAKLDQEMEALPEPPAAKNA